MVRAADSVGYEHTQGSLGSHISIHRDQEFGVIDVDEPSL